MHIDRHDHAGVFDFRFDDGEFNLDFINDLKADIPKKDREYDPATNVWTIEMKHLETFRFLYKRYFIGENQLDMEF